MTDLSRFYKSYLDFKIKHYQEKNLSKIKLIIIFYK